MLEHLDEKVSVVSVYNKDKGSVKPFKMRWKTHDIVFSEVTYHHLVREGRNILHVFHVTDGVMDYRLHLDTQTLHWKLIEISDGNP